MKKIGFVDYYLSEWHANNYPAWIKAQSDFMGEDFTVAYAWAELDVSPEDGVRTAEWCEKYGATPCASIAELCEKSDYIIVLAPSNPEKHLGYAKEVFKCGKRTYIDKTFAPNYAEAKEIFDLADAAGVQFFSSSALRFATELNGIAPSPDVSITGGGRSLEEYVIHQIEMAVKVQGVGACSVTVTNDGEDTGVLISYPDSRRTALDYKNSNSFAINGTEIVSEFFTGLIAAILRFFSNGEIPFDTHETLEVMKIRDALLAATDGETHKI